MSNIPSEQVTFLSGVKQRITLEQYLFLKENKKTFPIEQIEIVGAKIADASKLTVEQAREIKEAGVSKIMCGDSELSIDDYILCREKIEEVISDLYYPPKDDPDYEKVLFEQVIERLANLVSYNYEALVEEEGMEDKVISMEYYGIANTMLGGLKFGKDVCSGRARLVKNVFACLGIESKVIEGDRENPKRSGHAWNQIRLDGKWYNLDLTWDRDRYVLGHPTENSLRSDEHFLGHECYSQNRTPEEECPEDVPLYKREEIRHRIAEETKNILDTPSDSVEEVALKLTMKYPGVPLHCAVGADMIHMAIQEAKHTFQKIKTVLGTDERRKEIHNLKEDFQKTKSRLKSFWKKIGLQKSEIESSARKIKSHVATQQPLAEKKEEEREES